MWNITNNYNKILITHYSIDPSHLNIKYAKNLANIHINSNLDNLMVFRDSYDNRADYSRYTYTKITPGHWKLSEI